MLLVNVGLRQLSETVKEPVLWTQDFPGFLMLEEAVGSFSGPRQGRQQQDLE